MAKRKIVISEYDNIAALMEDDRAVEFIIHRGDMLLGDVYLATVENILPSIDAAFVNVGGDKMGFLHSSDVPGKGDLKERLEPKQQLVVQIMKEPTGHKGPRVSTNISLPGRFLVMMPESKGISISRKIMESIERSRLKSVVSLIKPPGVGVIIRTEAANQKESDITEDFETLLERWQNIVSMADTATPPTLLYRDQDLLYRVIREAVTEEVTDIIVDSAFGQQRAQQLLQNWNMDKGVKVTHFQGNQPILVGTGVDKEIKLALQTKVPLPSGGYLYIQTTEALTVVDVNSGKFTSLQSQAETIKLTNLEACKEIARQLRLRNIGGMIIVDFIDMESRANQLQVLQTFENELAPDKAKPQIGQLSDLGLVEMTRHRQGQSLSEIFTRRCHSCSGTGHAIEEFSWMHTGGDGDSRRQAGGRNKLPMRQPNRMQQVPKPAASVNQRRDKGRVLLGNLGDPAAQKKEAQSHVTPGNILLNTLAERKQGPIVSEHEPLIEVLNDKTFKALGVRLANAAKLAFLPLPINGILSRINPKANDIVSLVHSIEASPHLAMQSRFGDDGEDGGDTDFDGEGMGESLEDASEDVDAAIDHEKMSVEDAEPMERHAESAVAVVPRPMSPNGRPMRGRGRVLDTTPDEGTQEVLPLTVQESVKHPERAVSAETALPKEPLLLPRTVKEEAIAEPEAVETLKIDEVEEEKPRRGRPAKRQEEIVDDLAVIQAVAKDDTATKDDESADIDDDDALALDDDDTADSSTSAAAQAAAKRRRGRPAKRSIKKPPAKR